MMTEEEYYANTPPSDEVFDDIKQGAIKIWGGYDDTYGYASSKINQIKNLKNVKDNAWYMVAMFDVVNQGKLCAVVKPETRELILKAIGYPWE